MLLNLDGDILAASSELPLHDIDMLPYLEERSRSEIAELAGRQLIPAGVPVHHPAFDITPASLVTAIITDRGIVRPPFFPALTEVAG